MSAKAFALAPRLGGIACPVTDVRYQAMKAKARPSIIATDDTTRRWWRDEFKTVIERPLAFLILLALSPLMLVIAALIAATTGRPVIYRRRVAARGGGQFDAFKFRTMVNGAERVLELDIS